ncbi:MAG: DUF1731 domain-containing protein [Opitutaceae bacterium]
MAIIEGRLKGEIYNCAAPEPLRNADFMRKLRRAVGGLASYLGIPASKLILKVGAFVIRTETELILKSRKVAPLNLLQDGYTFKYPNLEDALEAIVIRRKRS